MQARPQHTPAPPTPPKTSRMTLANRTRGRLDVPLRVLLYGVEGIGKSTFAASAPGAIFLAAENGTAQLDVERFPEPQSFSDALEAVDALRTEEHDRKTVVVDTLDWLEPMCWEHVCKSANKPDIESFGYGKGYVAALDAWRTLLSRLDRLRAERGMHVVLLAHSWIKPFKNPDGDDFDRYELKLHAKAGGLMKEWADAVLFANYETFTRKANDRAKGVGGGARIVHTERRAAWDAKNRFGLPETLTLGWDEFEEAARAASPADPERLRAEVEVLLARVDAATRASAVTWLEKQTRSPLELSRLTDKLRLKANEQDISKEETDQ